MDAILESDWKYMKKLRPALLEELCARNNKAAFGILKNEHMSDLKKHRALYQHVKDSDRQVALCFDDWRRSTFYLRLIALDQHQLLSGEHVQNLSEEAQKKLKMTRELKAL